MTSSFWGALGGGGLGFALGGPLGALVGAHRRMREGGGCLRIVRPPPLVARAFELTGLDGVLDLCDDREQALAGAD